MRNGIYVPPTYTCYGASAQFTVAITEGDTIQIQIVGNSANNDFHYMFLNAIGDTLANAGPNLPASPAGTTMFTYVVICPCETDAAFTTNVYGMDADFAVINEYLPALYDITWCFGDSTSNVTGTLTTTHTYSTVGTYLVSVSITKISDTTCTNTYSDSVLINNCLANGDFTYATAASYTIEFNSTYNYDTTYYHLNWDFGDGTFVSGECDPQHVYSSAGTYTVSFSVEQVSDSSCINVYTQSVYVAYCGANAQFSFSTDGYIATLSVPGSYNYTYAWDFGDGNTYTGTGYYAYNQSHTYNSIDTFHVTLTVTDNSNPTCTDFYETDVYIDGCIADAAFSSSSSDYTVDVSTISYFDPSLYNITWYFGDGTTAQGLNNTSHTYSEIGSYEISLVIEDITLSYCTDSVANEVIVWGPCPLVAIDFTWIDNLDLSFVFMTDTTYNSSDYIINWNFGDGVSVTGGTTVNHTFYYEGTFYVTLTISHVSIPNCVITINYGVEAIICPADAGFYYNINNYIIYFHTNNYFSVSEYSILWDFGDGTTAEDSNAPNHTYNVPGVYEVTLTIISLSNPDCMDEQTQVLDLCELTSAFTASTDELEVTCTTSFDPGFYHIEWDFGDGTTAEDLSIVTHSYTGPGTYSICLTVTDLVSTLCTDEVCHNVTVNTISIDEYNDAEHLNIYPNPVSDILYIDFSHINYTGIYMTILNSTGQTVYSNDLNSENGATTFKVNTHSFAQGIYFIKFESGSGTVAVRKFIKQFCPIL